MKITFPVLLLAMVATTVISAQSDKSQRPSPPATVTATINGQTLTIDYSQPSVKDRKVWGGLVPYGEVWRTGANESTTIDLSDNMQIEGQKVLKGKYALFTIPGEKEWVIILNKGIAWGAYSYKEADDVLRFTVTPKASAAFHEKFTIDISKEGVVSLLWENLEVSFMVK